MAVLSLSVAVAAFVSTLLGGVAALHLQRRLHPVMAFAAGVLVATALVDLLPEARAQAGDDVAAAVGVAAVAGYLVFSALDAFLHRQSFTHRGHGHDEDHATTGALGLVGPAGLIVHSTLDGLAIGLGFRAGIEVGLVVALAVLAHDFADGMNVVTLALAGGRAPRSAALFLGLDALAPVVGAVVGNVVAIGGALLGLLLAVFAGVFLAIGAGHLLPEAEHRRPGIAPAMVLLAAAGAAVVIAVRNVLE